METSSSEDSAEPTSQSALQPAVTPGMRTYSMNTETDTLVSFPLVFTPDVEVDGDTLSSYQTITYQPAFQKISLEQLRLSDYMHEPSGKLRVAAQGSIKNERNEEILVADHGERGRVSRHL